MHRDTESLTKPNNTLGTGMKLDIECTIYNLYGVLWGFYVHTMMADHEAAMGPLKKGGPALFGCFPFAIWWQVPMQDSPL